MASKCDEEKNSFTNQVVKVKIVFQLFLVRCNGFLKVDYILKKIVYRRFVVECFV